MVGMLYVHALKASATTDAGEVSDSRRSALHPEDRAAFNPSGAIGRVGKRWETRLKSWLGPLVRAFPASRA